MPAAYSRGKLHRLTEPSTRDVIDVATRQVVTTLMDETAAGGQVGVGRKRKR